MFQYFHCRCYHDYHHHLPYPTCYQLSKKGLQVIAYDVSESAASRAIEVYECIQKSLVKYAKCNNFITGRDSGGVIKIAKVTCPVCRGSGKLPVTREPKAESHGEETVGECPTCHGKGEVDKEG